MVPFLSDSYNSVAVIFTIYYCPGKPQFFVVKVFLLCNNEEACCDFHYLKPFVDLFCVSVRFNNAVHLSLLQTILAEMEFHWMGCGFMLFTSLKWKVNPEENVILGDGFNLGEIGLYWCQVRFWKSQVERVRGVYDKVNLCNVWNLGSLEELGIFFTLLDVGGLLLSVFLL